MYLSHSFYNNFANLYDLPLILSFILQKHLPYYKNGL